MLHALTRDANLILSRLAVLVTCAVFVGGALAVPASAQGGGLNRRVLAQAEQYTGDRFTYFAETPRGAHVAARTRPRVEWLRAIDQGLTDLFAVARKHGYRARLNYGDYTIFIAKPDRTRDSTGAYSPDVAYVAPGYRARLNYSDYVIFIAKADRTRDSTGAYSPDVAYVAPGYRGSIYDQGGYIYAAGMSFSFEPCALVLAEHDRAFQRMANVVRYEGEHLVLYHNDRRLFQQTADHSRGGGHPILQ